MICVRIIASPVTPDLLRPYDDDGLGDDSDHEDEDFFPRDSLISNAQWFGAQSPNAQTYDYDDPGMQSSRESVIESRGMMGKNKDKGGGGAAGFNMSSMMINVTNDDHDDKYEDDDDDHEFEAKAEPQPRRIPNCKFQLPDKVIGMQKYVYIPRITVFDTDPHSDVMSVKGEPYDGKIKQCYGCGKKSKKKKKKKKKKGRRRR